MSDDFKYKPIGAYLPKRIDMLIMPPIETRIPDPMPKGWEVVTSVQAFEDRHGHDHPAYETVAMAMRDKHEPGPLLVQADRKLVVSLRAWWELGLDKCEDFQGHALRVPSATSEQLAYFKARIEELKNGDGGFSILPDSAVGEVLEIGKPGSKVFVLSPDEIELICGELEEARKEWWCQADDPVVGEHSRKMAQACDDLVKRLQGEP